MKIILGILLLCVMITPIFAHPGRTASDGCHYCRTNCEEWGVPLNERHCHNTSVEPESTEPAYTPPDTVTETPTSVEPEYTEPVYTPPETVTETSTPIPTPPESITPVEDEQEEIEEITTEPEVKSATTSNQISDTSTTNNGWVGWLVGLGGVGAIIYAAKKKI